MADTAEEYFAKSAKARLLMKVIEETRNGNIPWEYAFHEMSADYYAEWQGRILTIRWLQDEGPRLRVFAVAEEALITYDPARNAISLPRENKALVSCWEWELSKLNRLLCGFIAAYLNPEEDEPEEDEGSRQEKEQQRQDKAREHSVEELREIKKILGEFPKTFLGHPYDFENRKVREK